VIVRRRENPLRLEQPGVQVHLDYDLEIALHGRSRLRVQPIAIALVALPAGVQPELPHQSVAAVAHQAAGEMVVRLVVEVVLEEDLRVGGDADVRLHERVAEPGAPPLTLPAAAAPDRAATIVAVRDLAVGGLDVVGVAIETARVAVESARAEGRMGSGFPARGGRFVRQILIQSKPPAGIGAPFLFAGDDVHHAAEGVRPVEHGRRPADHLDAGDLRGIQREDVVAAGTLLGEPQAIDQDQDAFIEEAADHRADAARARGRDVDARRAIEDVDHGLGHPLVEVGLIDHVHRQGRVQRQAVIAGGGDHDFFKLVGRRLQCDPPDLWTGCQATFPAVESGVIDPATVFSGGQVGEAKTAVGVGPDGPVEIDERDRDRSKRLVRSLVDNATGDLGSVGSCRHHGDGNQ